MEKNARKEFFGIVVPLKVLGSGELTITEKLIYSYITSYTKGICYDTNERIADRLGLSVRSVTRSLKGLQKKSYIFVDFGQGNTSRRRIYDVLDKPNKLRVLARKAGNNESEFSTTFSTTLKKSEFD